MRAIMSKKTEKRLSTREGRIEVAKEVNERMQNKRLSKNDEDDMLDSVIKIKDHIGLLEALSHNDMEYIRSCGIKCDQYHIIGGTYIVRDRGVLSDIRDAIQSKIANDVTLLFNDRKFVISACPR